MLAGFVGRIDILLSCEKNGVEIGPRLRSLQKPFVFEPFDVGKFAQRREPANSDASRPWIPISFRPPFRFEAGHHSEMKPAT